jgi:hypothetical protein
MVAVRMVDAQCRATAAGALCRVTVAADIRRLAAGLRILVAGHLMADRRTGEDLRTVAAGHRMEAGDRTAVVAAGMVDKAAGKKMGGKSGLDSFLAQVE